MRRNKSLPHIIPDFQTVLTFRSVFVPAEIAAQLMTPYPMRSACFPSSHLRLLLVTSLLSWPLLGSLGQVATAVPPSVPATHLTAALPDQAPAELSQLLKSFDAAASKQDQQAVLQFYADNFTSSDGLNRATQTQTLKQFWQNYQALNYSTEIVAWEPSPQGYQVETVTTITGVRQMKDREMALEATLRSQQQISNQKIVSQKILAERSQLTSGKKPPLIEVNLPEQVNTGQEYSFDVIVKEPLGDSLLLGAALEEPINTKAYLEANPVKLEILPAGGIFKVGRAPAQPTAEWISAVLVHEGGIVMYSQRLNVVKRSSVSRTITP